MKQIYFKCPACRELTEVGWKETFGDKENNTLITKSSVCKKCLDKLSNDDIELVIRREGN